LFVVFSTGWFAPLLGLFADLHSNITPASNCQYGLCLSKTPGNGVDETIPGLSVKMCLWLNGSLFFITWIIVLLLWISRQLNMSLTQVEKNDNPQLTGVA